jgi:putative CocE/NonD family hydrolase
LDIVEISSDVSPTEHAAPRLAREAIMNRQSGRSETVVAVFVALGCAAAFPARAEVTCTVDKPTINGVRMATEVYRLKGATGRSPVVLQRTPYNRFPPGAGNVCNSGTHIYLAERGYVALNQDVRGRFRSDGVMDAMQQEAADGYAAVEWAAAQSWSTGKVGMFGGSYVGLTQWQPAIHTPPHLAAIAPMITASEYHDHWTYVNGAFDLWFAQSWMLLTFAGEQYMRNLEAQGYPPPVVQAKTAEWVAEGRRDILTKWVWQLPLSSFDVFRKGNPQPLAPYYYDWIAHPNYDGYWAKMDIETRYENVEVPTLNIGWWYDIFQIGTVRNFQRMQTQGGTAAARKGTQLLMWAQCHACPPGTKAGEIDFGPQNTYDLDALYARFFDRWLKGIDNGIDKEPAARLFVMLPPDSGTQGSGFWISSETFPLKGTKTVPYLLKSGGRANTASGDGALVRGGDEDGDGDRNRGDDDSAADRFTYDPRHPVPTKGGDMCCINDLLPSGAFDQRDIERRDDVLVYTSAPLHENMAVIGQVNVKLWARSSAPDTDFTAKLVDVHPDGYAQNILDRLVRARYRQGSKLPPSFIRPGKAYEYTIELGNTSTVFKPGHRIRLEVSSSNFPHYVRNQNTTDDVGATTRMVTAHQTILHDDEHPSRVDLPVAPIKIP